MIENMKDRNEEDTERNKKIRKERSRKIMVKITKDRHKLFWKREAERKKEEETKGTMKNELPEKLEL